jgi:hypothetical protein
MIRQNLRLLTKKNSINRRAYSDTSYKIKRSPVSSPSSSGSTTPTASQKSPEALELATFEITAC